MTLGLIGIVIGIVIGLWFVWEAILWFTWWLTKDGGIWR